MWLCTFSLSCNLLPRLPKCWSGSGSWSREDRVVWTHPILFPVDCNVFASLSRVWYEPRKGEHTSSREESLSWFCLCGPVGWWESSQNMIREAGRAPELPDLKNYVWALKAFVQNAGRVKIRRNIFKVPQSAPQRDTLWRWRTSGTFPRPFSLPQCRPCFCLQGNRAPSLPVFFYCLVLCKPTLGHNPNQRKKDLCEIKCPDLFNIAGVKAGAYKSLQDF